MATQLIIVEKDGRRIGAVELKFEPGVTTARFKDTHEDCESDTIEYIAEALAGITDGYHGIFRPGTVRAITEAFTNISHEAEDLDDAEYMFGSVRDINTHVFAFLLMEFLAECTDAVESETLSRAGKRRAIDVAEVLGPDWAQLLYRFAVLTTKLA